MSPINIIVGRLLVPCDWGNCTAQSSTLIDAIDIFLHTRNGRILSVAEVPTGC